MRKKQIKEIWVKKKEKIRAKKKEEMKSSVYQIVERSSFLYDCIQKDYTLINKVYLLFAKNDNIPILNKLNQDYKIIDDINNGKYKSFKWYIYHICCAHFYHNRCRVRNLLKKIPYFAILLII